MNYQLLYNVVLTIGTYKGWTLNKEPLPLDEAEKLARESSQGGCPIVQFVDWKEPDPSKDQP